MNLGVTIKSKPKKKHWLRGNKQPSSQSKHTKDQITWRKNSVGGIASTFHSIWWPAVPAAPGNLMLLSNEVYSLTWEFFSLNNKATCKHSGLTYWHNLFLDTFYEKVTKLLLFLLPFSLFWVIFILIWVILLFTNLKHKQNMHSSERYTWLNECPFAHLSSLGHYLDN